jgi:hypothetical protein
MASSTSFSLPVEILNHIFSYCQGRTNKIMKDHIECLDQVYQDELYVYEYQKHLYDVVLDCKASHLRYILHLMGFYGQIYFNKELFYSRYYSCVNCRRVGYALPYVEFGEKFCSSQCADMFDY